MPFLILIAALIAIVFFAVRKRNDNEQEQGHVSTDNHSLDSAPVNKTQEKRSQIDKDNDLAKKIMIYGGIGCVIVGVIIGIGLAFSDDPDAFGIGVFAIFAVIALGAILPNKKKKAIKYKNYFIDQLNRIHNPIDLDFDLQLLRYSEYNEQFFLKPISAAERGFFIIDGKGNKVDIRKKPFIMRDSHGNYCCIKR